VFDTIAGLPVHPLVVHAVVVLLPLAALGTIAVSVRAAWRPYAKYLLGVNVLVLVVAFVARQSGEALYERISSFGENELVENHVDYGSVLPLFALFLVVAAAVVMASVGRPKLAPVAIVVAVVAGLAGIGWTVVTGDSGARAVWEATIESTNG
jgi:uncharacterized membrane protein